MRRAKLSPNYLPAGHISYSHILIVLSSDPDARRDPSLLYATELTDSVCPVHLSVWSNAPSLLISHIFIVSSSDPDAMSDPSLLYVTDLTPCHVLRGYYLK